jgi:predicted KAP-like P-loop ATPase
MRVWADTETDTDFLNYSEVAELIAELINDKSLLPLSLGVFGGWGIGKSSTLNLVEAELSKTPDDYLIVRFDAWLYQDFDDARAALMSVISSTLTTAAPPQLKEKAKRLLDRVNKLRAFGLALEGGAALLGFPTFGALAKGVEAGGKLLSGGSTEGDKAAVADAARDVSKKAEGLLDVAVEPAQEIAAFRKDFGEVLTGLDKTLVVFIDNLDRCLPANAIHTLEAIRLFVFLPNTAFVIAADEDMVRHAVSEHFKDPGERHVTDYLDKLIQLPVFVPRPGVLEVQAYLSMLVASGVDQDAKRLDELRRYLLEELCQSWREPKGYDVGEILGRLGRGDDDVLRAQLETALRMAPMLAHSDRVNGNPRIIKRLMNVVRMRTSIARKRGMDLDEAIIAKLALLERCTDGQAVETLQNAISIAPSGKAEMLSAIEAASTETELEGLLPDSWKKHAHVIRDWTKLDPKLGGIDLRPAVYLARETVPLQIGGSRISAETLAAIDQLLKTPTISSQVASEAAASIKVSERAHAMDELVAAMRKDSDWSKARADFRGAIILAKASADAATILNRFIKSIKGRPKWMNAMLDNQDWADFG